MTTSRKSKTPRTRRPPPHEPTEEIKRLLAELELFTVFDHLDEALGRLEYGETTAIEMFKNLLLAETQTRLERRIERRIRDSKLPERKTFAEFDFPFQPSLDKSLIMELATMGFVSRGQGVILAGKSGTGKSHIAKALALEGCKKAMRVRYTTAAQMLSDLYASLADDSIAQKLKRYTSPDLLVVDEVGFDRLEQENARNAALFFKVIDGRYGKCSTIFTTNIDFEQLGHYLGDPLATTSIVDRLVHHSTVINIDGPSWRHKVSKELNCQMRARSDSRLPPAKKRAKDRTPITPTQ